MTVNTYLSNTGWLYRFDPRAKIFFLVLLLGWVFLPVTLAGMGCMLFLILFTALSNPGPRFVRSTFTSILPMIIFMVLFAPFNVRSGKGLITIRSFVLLTEEGALQALRLAIRFISITYLATLLFATTPMPEILLALQWYRLPYKASLIITLAFTYIPFIADGFAQIEESHRLREAGAHLERKRIGRIRSLIPTLTSSLVLALRSIPTLALSLELRGYGRANKRTRYHDLSSYRRTFTDFLISGMIPVISFLVFKA
ncbi:MAG: energy-coupling factor transporter transmembrane component T family protein [Sphaerochaeta sp.]|jgi:energy-coupling factor transport system permease protein